jgi:hypothetical protein
VEADGWEAESDDLGCRVQVDYAFTVSTTDDYSFRIEEPFVFVDVAGREHALVPEGDPAGLAVALVVARTRLSIARAFDDGRLELHFCDGSEILVSSSERFEPWVMTGPDGLMLVSVPGGELAVWLPNFGQAGES